MRYKYNIIIITLNTTLNTLLKANLITAKIKKNFTNFANKISIIKAYLLRVV